MPKNKPLKLIIDTNLWVSFIISGKLNQIESLLLSKKARLLFSTDLIIEIELTISKPKLKKFFGRDALTEMLAAFEDFIDLINVVSIVTICRDPKDNFLLELAKDGGANYLLTGDKDLLVIENFGKTKITTITNFLTEHAANR